MALHFQRRENIYWTFLPDRAHNDAFHLQFYLKKTQQEQRNMRS